MSDHLSFFNYPNSDGNKSDIVILTKEGSALLRS
ncbi:MAG: hypothetical protein K0S32_4424 [Bacteroidetes bacterium]|jgi:hypothetical protein|nr:hypothetical protein [Bacteroidota bacterium]